jgi:hypothetical protein
MKHLLATFSFLFIVNLVLGQNKVNISLVGSVVNYSTTEKLFGATLYFMQNGKTVSKSISDEIGRYSISGNVLIDQPIDLLVSKPGYASKKVLFDIKTLGKTNSVQLVEELTIQLHEICNGSDLSFTKTDYAEKFTWAGNSAKPDKNYKEQIDQKIIDACSKVKKSSSAKNYVSRADIANKNRQFEKAVAYYDSAMVANPNDSSSIRVKKDIVLGTIKKIQEEETKKANYNSKKLLADTSLSNGDLANAEKNYKEMLNVFPGDSYATGQLAKITSLKNQQELDKKNKAEADKLIAQANTLKNSKKYDEAIAKLQQAIALIPNKKDDLNKEINVIKAIQSDIAIEEQVKKDLENAANLFKDKKFDEAIKTYEGVDQKITKFTNEALKNSLSKKSQDGAQKVKLSKDGVKTQLQRAQDIFDKGPAFYNEAENTLNGAPLKSFLNDPEVIALRDKISKMKDFYKQKTEAYKEVTSKKNNESALSKLKSTVNFATKLGTIAPPSELSKLNKSIDSLENILKPKNNTPNTTQTNNVAKVGNRLKAPGELITGNPNDAINELAENIEAKKEAPLEKMTELKNEIDNEAYFNRKLNASRQEDEMRNIQDKKTEIDLKAIEQSKVPEQLQENLNEKKQNLETNLYEKQQENLKQNEVRSNQIQDWKNQTDSLSSAKLVEKEKNIENDMARVQETKNTIELKAINIKNQNEELAQSVQKTKTETEYFKYKQDSLNAVASENMSKELQKKKDYQKEDKFAANNLADENGVPFDKNKMTERVYKIKNKEGFVTTIITRRVVVDKNGYGVVYEQTTNESGNNSFTKNGSPITEYIWANESTGINVIEK